MKWFGALAVALAISAGIIGCGAGDDNSEAPESTPALPATREHPPVAPAPLAAQTPLAAVRAVLTSLQRRDSGQFDAAVLADDEAFRAASFGRMAAAMAFCRAYEKAFGTAAVRKVPGYLLDPDRTAAEVTVTVDGDEAAARMPNGQTWALVKSDGRWRVKLRVPARPVARESTIRYLTGQAAAIDRVTATVGADGQTAEAALNAYQRALVENLFE